MLKDLTMQYKRFGNRTIYRGDVTGNDFDSGDFTKDNAYHELDLSSIIPNGTKFVTLKILVKTDTSGHTLTFRRKGNANEYNTLTGVVPIGLVNFWIIGRCFVSTDGKIEYKLPNTTYQTLTLLVVDYSI